MMESSSYATARHERRPIQPPQTQPGRLPLAEIWEDRVEEMPLSVLLRSLNALSGAGLLTGSGEVTRAVIARIGDPEVLREARPHPIELLAARMAYLRGGERGARRRSKHVAELVEALDAAFYLALAAVRPSGLRTLVSLDVSGSMASPVRGLPLVSCREAAAAMALVTAAREPDHRFAAFAHETAPGWIPRWRSGLSPITISPAQRLEEVVHLTGWLSFGGTDCALPMLEAAKRRWSVDLFVVYTDSETGVGEVHPAEALRRYRDRTGIAARLVVVGMASRGFTLADPDDGGMLDVVGFDTSTPRAIGEFSA